MKKLMILSAITVLAIIAYLTWIRPWHLRWGATDLEVLRSLPGDDVAHAPDFDATRAVTINTPARDIWPWLVQIGYDRAGWYSYDCIDNLCRPSAEKILPKFQDIAIGNKVPVSPWVNMRVRDFEPDQWILWESARGDGTWLWYLEPVDEKRTRLISRMRFTYHWESPFILVELASDVGDIFMLRKCMLGIKRRAESGVHLVAQSSKW